jgi:hypothetical protein
MGSMCSSSKWMLFQWNLTNMVIKISPPQQTKPEIIVRNYVGKMRGDNSNLAKGKTNSLKPVALGIKMKR